MASFEAPKKFNSERFISKFMNHISGRDITYSQLQDTAYFFLSEFVIWRNDYNCPLQSYYYTMVDIKNRSITQPSESLVEGKERMEYLKAVERSLNYLLGVEGKAASQRISIMVSVANRMNIPYSRYKKWW